MTTTADKAVNAFLNRKSLSVGNTVSTGYEIILFGKTIAKYSNGEIWITDAGWPKRTTYDRLNTLLQRVNKSFVKPISIKKGQTFLGDKPWNGDWINIGKIIEA